ncbi:peptidoglycan editing factor PgeF [Hyphococcus flavus]|uniref:Purine nucleoside phosphorylase n=1 Tax=Hyphococcus flavus TaxID=1866326 RepID=A0AAE9ZHZ6_9PROT|nr:peptidoglycan editing factor PgeF [Hyphococcus flavus]WDI30585.1 peptidoglycan editing factor PgeF [Hyphococcus flavus]
MSAVPPYLVSPLLDASGVAHAFFTRDGGVSNPPYDSLNTGPGSGDNQDDVAENRARCASVLGVRPDHLLTSYQTHSPDVMVVDEPWRNGAEKVDALVTKTPGVAIGVLAADCMPFLFADPQARIIGAAHAGWRGALAGVLENTVETMVELGAARENIGAAIGPCLRQPNFEVGLDLFEQFTSRYSEAERFFAPGKNDEKRQFDLVSFGLWRISTCGVTKTEDTNICTLGTPNRFFSYRAMRRDGLSDYGRNLSAIALM